MNIPNSFAGGQFEEAYTDSGWVTGPGVANFVFTAARNNQLPMPPGRYGATAAEWRPFLPDVARTISEIARAAAKKHSLRYREIVVNSQLVAELQDAKNRKNLTLVLADPQTLQINEYQVVSVFDGHTWEGAALLVPWNDVPDSWSQVALPVLVASFPIKTQLNPPAYLAPIVTADEFDRVLDVTLADLRTLFTRVESEKKARTDIAPAQLEGPGEASP
jgi:hypothetical protein